MYAVTAYASHADREAGEVAYHEVFELRGDAMDEADVMLYPIVDVRDIGRVGECPGRPRGTDGVPLGHRFDVQAKPVACSDCSAWVDDLYVPGTYWPRHTAPRWT